MAPNPHTHDQNGKRRVKAACTNCKKAKARCDQQRPCRRCVERNCTECVDAFPRRVGRRRNHFFKHIVTEQDVKLIQKEKVTKSKKTKTKRRAKRTRRETKTPPIRVKRVKSPGLPTLQLRHSLPAQIDVNRPFSLDNFSIPQLTTNTNTASMESTVILDSPRLNKYQEQPTFEFSGFPNILPNSTPRATAMPIWKKESARSQVPAVPSVPVALKFKGSESPVSSSFSDTESDGTADRMPEKSSDPLDVFAPSPVEGMPSLDWLADIQIPDVTDSGLFGLDTSLDFAPLY